MMYNLFFYIKFGIYLLSFVFYINFLHIFTKFFGLKLNVIDYMIVSLLFLILLLRCCLDDLDGHFTVYLYNNFIIYNDLIKLFKTCITLFFFAYSSEDR